MSTIAIPTPDRWHRPLLALAAAMAVLAVVVGVLALVDDRELLGQDVWAKPLKFALSIGLYALTLAWLVGQLRRWRRVADVAGTVTAVALAIEMVIIVGAAAAGTTSHFNVSTPFATTLWSVMAASIAAVWIAGLVVAIGLVRHPMADPARALAVRAGIGIGLAGMAVAFLMTGPTSAQLADFHGIAGAHAVGVPDGGPGLPLLGWSTEGGDLRVPHFVGMHALQLLPLAALGLEALALRAAALRDARVRLRLVAIAAAAMALGVALLTVQALAGQPVVAPSGGVLVAGVAIAALALGGAAVVVRGAVEVRGRRSPVDA